MMKLQGAPNSMAGTIHLIKLSVGSDSVEQIEDWQQNRSKQRANEHYFHLTRMWPKRADTLLNGGSLYWVFKGVILCRQRIVRLDEVQGGDGILRCGIVLDPEVVRTHAAPRRPFQGWRYLPVSDAPPDLRAGRTAEETLPADLNRALAEIGVI